MDTVDWQINKAPLECTKYLLENEVNCDVNFRIGEDTEIIKAHKLILSMRSPVFDRMFNGGFEESEKHPVIPDVTAAAFQALLRYCYYECLDIEDDAAFAILYASTKYMLPLLEEAAREKLIETISVSNVWDLYEYAISFGDTELHAACKMYFKGDITPVREALQDEAFLTIPHEVLLDVLHINDKAENKPNLNEKLVTGDELGKHAGKHDDKKDKSGISILENDQADTTSTMHANLVKLNDSDTQEGGVIYKKHKNNFGISISEFELLKACMAWAEAECIREEIEVTGTNKQIVLGVALFLIRFPTMLLKDLMTVYTTGILTSEEMINMSQYPHIDPRSECQIDFPLTERQFVVTALFKEPPSRTANMSTVFIESSERVMLSRLWVFEPHIYRVTVQDETSHASVSMDCDSKLSAHCTKEIMDEKYCLCTMDVKPQLLKSGTKYSITIEATKKVGSEDEDLITKWVVIGNFSPFKEVRITSDPEVNKSIYALTLCLV